MENTDSTTEKVDARVIIEKRDSLIAEAVEALGLDPAVLKDEVQRVLTLRVAKVIVEKIKTEAAGPKVAAEAAGPIDDCWMLTD